MGFAGGSADSGSGFGNGSSISALLISTCPRLGLVVWATSLGLRALLMKLIELAFLLGLG